MNDGNDSVRHLRDYAPYQPPDVEPAFLTREDVEASARRNQEIFAGWFIVASIVLVLVALAVAVWPR